MSVIETASRRWDSFCNQLLNLFFPPRCIGCHQVGAWFCADMGRIPRVEPPFCVRCGNTVINDELCPRCQNSPLQIESIRSAVYFEGVLRQAMHWFKYRGRTVLAEPLGGLMAECWIQQGVPIDVVVPVPLHAARWRERGYNQAALLAREMARQAGLRVNEKALIRQRATASQVELDASQRKENVRAAFSCSSDELAGKRVLLIDDVCTTGGNARSLRSSPV